MDRISQQRYKDQPLAYCEAKSIGQETPRKTTESPEIILEPLRTLYSSCYHKRSDFREMRTTPVKIIVYGSGIVVEEPKTYGKNIVNWFPIQNLYCSAGLIPDKGKTEPIVFRQLHEKTKKPHNPLFAMVVRQPGDDGRRVLMCHAFIVDDSRLAQQLVNATEYAYRNKEGWNHPVNDKEFLNAKLSYTLQQINEEEDVDLERLRITTEERDKQLAQVPNFNKQKPPSARKQRFRSASEKRIQSAPATPRRVAISMPMPMPISMPRKTQSLIGGRGTAVPKPFSTRVPTQRAASYYQGFNTQTTLNGSEPHGVTKAASVGGFPVSRSSSAMASRQTRKSSFTANDYIPASQHRHVPSTSHTTNGFTPLSKSEKPIPSTSHAMSNGYRHSRKQQQTPAQSTSYTINSIDSTIRSEPEPIPSTSYAANGFTPASQTQEASAPSTPRSHRILASSEPQEAVNDIPNGNGFGIMDWNDIVEDSHANDETSPTNKKHNRSKHHRPSKKMMEKYSHQNGDVNGNSLDQDHDKKRKSSSKEKPNYSITKMDEQPNSSMRNGFFQADEHADQTF